MDIPARKRALRRETLARILATDPSRRLAEEAALAERFPALPGFDAAGWVLLYASAFAEEIATGPFLQAALDGGTRLVLPRADRAARCLRLYPVAAPAADLRPGALGIPEPRSRCPVVEPGRVDWVLVPGLAFDGLCYRLGRGAGYYDRL